MSDYTLIASNQHDCCILYLGHNDLTFFWQRFGSKLHYV